MHMKWVGWQLLWFQVISKKNLDDISIFFSRIIVHMCFYHYFIAQVFLFYFLFLASQKHNLYVLYFSIGKHPTFKWTILLYASWNIIVNKD